MYLKDARDKNAVTALLIFTTSIKWEPMCFCAKVYLLVHTLYFHTSKNVCWLGAKLVIFVKRNGDEHILLWMDIINDVLLNDGISKMEK